MHSRDGVIVQLEGSVGADELQESSFVLLDNVQGRQGSRGCRRDDAVVEVRSHTPLWKEDSSSRTRARCRGDKRNTQRQHRPRHREPN
jgi:hypothetical protein